MLFITKTIVRAFSEIFNEEINEDKIIIEPTKKEFEGQFTFVVFPFLKLSKLSPEQTAQKIGDYLQLHLPEVEKFNIIKGFLNITLSASFWIKLFIEKINRENFDVFEPNGENVLVEYSSPNTNKPLHLGHVRNNLLGYSIAEILKATGYNVTKANLVNDRGIHICKSMLAWQKFGQHETPESSNIKGDHLVGKYYVIFDKEYKKQIDELISLGNNLDFAKKNAPLILEAQEMLQKWEAGDSDTIQLWQKMNEWVYSGFNETYQKLGVDFDKYYYESNTYLLGKDMVAEGLQKQVFFKKVDGSVWIDLTNEGLDEKLVQRADGTSVYITQDLGTAQLKFNDFNTDKSIYVVGNEQDYHFKVLFIILEKLGKTWAKGLYHLSYGMVDLPNGKMKSREGTVVDADELIKEMEETAKQKTEELGKVADFTVQEKNHLYFTVGMGALKYFLLKVEPKKRLLFDPNESVDFQGNTGPFIQYSYARIKSVLTKSNFKQAVINNPSKISDSEIELINLLKDYRMILFLAAKNYNPATVANYLYELAKSYNKFYQSESILKVEDDTIKYFRLTLSDRTAQIIKKGLSLLGIAVVDKM